ncbi:MAG: TraX family protein [Xanthomonas sp.]
MTSGARELLKWIALVLMTGDHVAKIFYGGYVPIVSELGRIAFPVFAIVLAYNLAQPGADALKSFRRLLLWGILAQPAHGLAFGFWLPFNVLLSFAVAAAAIWSIQHRQWVLLGMCSVVAPLLVDYQWSGLALVLSSWWLFRVSVVAPGGATIAMTPTASRWWSGRGLRLSLVAIAFGLLCWYNRNGWALLAIPLLVVLAPRTVRLHRMRWAFYGYYVGHLAVLALLARVLAV